VRLRLLYQLWGDWIEAIGDPDRPDEMFDCVLEATDCFQGATFNLLHGFYRTALAELRTALELVMIGAYGNLYPVDKDYQEWKAGNSELFGYTRCRKRLLGNLKKEQAKWMSRMTHHSHPRIKNYANTRMLGRMRVIVFCGKVTDPCTTMRPLSLPSFRGYPYMCCVSS
jgi:hypothetical protein